MGDQIKQYGPNAIGKIVFPPAPQPPPPQPEPRPEAALRTVLMLMSNPLTTPRLRLDKEHRAIDEAIVDARFREQIDLRVGTAPRYYDLQDLLLRHRPTVVHYAGHSGAGGIALDDDRVGVRPVAPAALEGLFRIVRGNVRCVVLNACLTENQALAISAHIPCVVGMTRSVLDEVAIEFAAGFYRALADGLSVADSVEFGRNRLELAGMDARDPVLIAADGIAERLAITG